MASIPHGRRDRNMHEKLRRIFDAAETLFEERGFEAVTTSQVSERADIGTGTLFRYATSKTELLLLVYNEKLRIALQQSTALSVQADNLIGAIIAMLSPLVELGRTSGENGTVYQRELLFGTSAQTYRQEGLALIADLEAAIARRLKEQAALDGLPEHLDAARLASSSIFAATHLAITRKSTGAHLGREPQEDLRGQIQQIVTGYFALLEQAETAPKTTKTPPQH